MRSPPVVSSHEYAMIPHADTRLRIGDSVIAMIKSEREKELREVFALES